MTELQPGPGLEHAALSAGHHPSPPLTSAHLQADLPLARRLSTYVLCRARLTRPRADVSQFMDWILIYHTRNSDLSKGLYPYICVKHSQARGPCSKLLVPDKIRKCGVGIQGWQGVLVVAR